MPPRYIAVPFTGGGAQIPIPDPVLTTTVVSGSQINLSVAYVGPPGAVSYAFELATSGAGPFSPLSSGTSSTFNATGLLSSTTYFFRCRVQVNDGRFSNFSAIKSATTLAAVPAQPTGVVATGTSQSTVTVVWNPVSQATGYRIYRDSAFISTAVASPFNDGGLLAGHLYTYQVSATNAAGEGPLSVADTAQTSAAAGAAIKWVPGHYADYDTVVSTGGGISTIQFEVDLMKPYDNCLGYMIAPTWGNLQQQNGVYTWAGLDSIINYLTNRSGANFNRPKYYWISVVAGSFTKSHPGSKATYNPGDFSILPQYLMNNVGAYGAAGYRLAGVTTNVGTSGWWGGDGNGETYGAALWRPNVSEEWIQLHEAIGQRYNSDPFYMGNFHGENSFYQGTGSTNGDGTYNDITFENNNKAWMQRATASHPNTNIGFSNTYLKFQNNTTDLTNWMMTTNTLSHPVIMGQTDTFGLSYGGGVGHNSWGMAAYVGAVAGIPDFRPKGLCACEVQAPDIGFFKNTGGWDRDDIRDSLNNHEQAQFAFWAIVPRSIAPLPARANLVPDNWFNGSAAQGGADGLGAFINNPVNRLIHTSYPPSYP